MLKRSPNIYLKRVKHPQILKRVDFVLEVHLHLYENLEHIIHLFKVNAFHFTPLLELRVMVGPAS